MKPLILALALIAFASTADAKTKLNCGLPHPDAACSVSPPVRPSPVTPKPTPLVTTSTPQAVIGNLITGNLVQTVISDLQTLDTVAGVVNPTSTLPAPYNTYLPEAHACIAVAVPFLQNLPSMSSIPSPSGPGGVFTTVGMAEINLNAVQGFLSSLSTTSLEPLKMGCAAWAQSIITAPSTILAGATADTVNFITMFHSL